ncbi:MAG: hypothetical protein JW891_13585 [Candidatus Lokiarchaeota archaeon]|nr:hypothetical protein [Candidatus Lokiarchaeota archaeon]
MTDLNQADRKIVRMFLNTNPECLNDIVIVPAVKSVLNTIVSQLQSRSKLGKIINGKINGLDISVLGSNIGAPNMAITMECLKRCACKIVVRLDYCGGIQNEDQSISIGDIIIPRLAYADEGTSPHYFLKYNKFLSSSQLVANPHENMIKHHLGNQKIVLAKPNLKLMETLLAEGKNVYPIEVKSGDILTTDALFCESLEFLESLKKAGIHAIDMESSILFLLGEAFSIRTAAILIVSDMPGSKKHDLISNGDTIPDLINQIKKSIEIVGNALLKIDRMK